MKIFLKNKFLKIASLLVVVFLITTCVIGTTFAKYTTGASGSDSARIAKWGIEVSASGSLFGKNYGSADTIVANGDAGITVAAGADYKVVAPGTKNDTGFQVKISGTPEVAYKMTATATPENIKDIFLKKGTYGMMVEQYGLNAASDVTSLYVKDGVKFVKATGAYDSAKTYYKLQDAVTIANDYYPIAWTVNTTDYTSLAAAVAEIVAQTGTASGKIYNSGENSAKEYTLKWSWDYEDATTPGIDNEDKADTILGNLAAAKTNIVKLGDVADTYVAVETTDYSLEVGFEYNITIEQVDKKP